MKNKVRIIVLLLIVVMGMGLASNRTGYAKEKEVKPSEKAHTFETIRQKPNRENIKWDFKMKKKSYDSLFAKLKKKAEKGKRKNEKRRAKGKPEKTIIQIDHDVEMVTRLKKIVGKLAEVSLMPELPYEVHYIGSNLNNAISYPGGGLFVCSGLFDPKDGLVNPANEDEIAAILSHEMAHVSLRHEYRRQERYKRGQVLC